VEAVAIFVDGDVGHDWNLRRGLTAGKDCLMDLFEVSEGFQHEDVDAAFKESCGLLAKGLPGLFTRDLAERFNTNADGADGTGNQRCAALLVDCFASDLGAIQVKFAYLFRQAVPRESEGISSKGVGLDDVSAGGQVVKVD